MPTGGSNSKIKFARPRIFPDWVAVGQSVLAEPGIRILERRDRGCGLGGSWRPLSVAASPSRSMARHGSEKKVDISSSLNRVVVTTTIWSDMRIGGVTEVAQTLGVSRQRVATLRQRPDFPDPVAEIAQGPVWDLDGIEEWAGAGLRSSSGRPTSASAARVVGGRFVLEEPPVGRGGFAEVFRALDRKESRREITPVAVKVLRDMEHVDPNAVRRFRRELRLMEDIRHPNVVSIIAHGETDQGKVWYAMPFAQGDLFDSIDRFREKNALILDVMRQVCSGLAHIHEREIYHRDLKPANILRFEDGRWAISDFGLAVEGERQTTMLTSTHVGLGTQGYTAPEQWRDARNVDHRADIYSLGKVLQALATGEAPIGGTMPTGPLRQIIQRATADRPGDRYSSVEEFLSRLETAIEGPVGVLETSEETAERLLERIRKRHPAAADLEELAVWAAALDPDDSEDMKALTTVLPGLSTWSIRQLWTVDAPRFRTIFGYHSADVETSGFGFAYCDLLAEFARAAVTVTGDTEILRCAVRSLVELGHSHNRWYVRDVVTSVLQKISDDEHAFAAADALRGADFRAVDWTLDDFSIRSLRPILRKEIEDLRKGPRPDPDLF